MGQTVSHWTSAFWDFLSPPKPNEPGYSNRQAAFASAKLAQTASSQSQASYHQNNHQEARKFSDLSKKHWKEYNRLNSLAEKEIFNHHNPTYPTDLSKIDLHGLLVKEATIRVEKHVELCKRSGIARTILITGWGGHSKEGLAKIKPAIRELCHREQLRVLVDKPNIGCITVEIGVSSANVGWENCIIM
jgi:DNA-nicking Smr family endonuclease